ncbi:MAG: VPLPA-CTERM sorting domain-containing protein [Pseudomonadota bacterium]
MNKILAACAIIATFSVSSVANASSLPPLSGDYKGTYALTDTFIPENNSNGFTHGLYLPGFIGDASWSVDSGKATYSGNTLDLSGTVSKTVNNVFYSLNFDFLLFETANAPNGLVCGGSNGPGTCKSQQDPTGTDLTKGENYIVHFDMGVNALMGTITGSVGNVLEGLSMDVEMVPLSGSNRKPGQLGYGGNWFTDDFGYSNWLKWEVKEDSIAQAQYGRSGKGDVNFTLVATPLPAGVPLFLTGLAGLYALRRRKKSA